MLRHADAYYAFAFSMTPAERERGYLVHVLSDRDSAKEVRAFGTAPWLRGRYEALTGERLRGLRRVLATQLRAQVVASAATSVLVAALLLGLLQLSLTGRLGLADLTVAAGLVTVAGGRVSGVGWAVGELWEAALFVRDVTDLTDIVAARTPSTATTSGTGSASRTGGPAAVTALETVDVDAVHFTYPAGDREALRGVDLQIGAGEIVALVGENGSGKTTLAKLIGGFYAPSGGRVRWNGLDCATLDEAGTAALREQVTVLFQDFVHYLLSARLNIALGHPDALDDTAAVEAAARAAGANSVVSGLPQGYETLLAPAFFGGTDLSGGQWQRIALARALVRHASLVVLDEPTAALDPRAEHELFARIRALFAGRAVLLVSHRFSTVREADRIYVLHEGEVVEQGTHDELVARGGRYAELYELQASSFR
jgi:ATP-binding cassette subfamily B protein